MEAERWGDCIGTLCGGGVGWWWSRGVWRLKGGVTALELCCVCVCGGGWSRRGGGDCMWSVGGVE